MPVHDLAWVLNRIAERSASRGGGCRVWTGMVNHKGYGMIRCGGKMVTVHRVVYAAKNGPIPDDMHVLHKCDNRRCCNEDHLFLGTNQENIDDKCRKDRSGKKLNIGKVVLIRELAVSGKTNAEIAAIFGVNASNISRAVSGERWSHVSIGVP